MSTRRLCVLLLASTQPPCLLTESACFLLFLFSGAKATSLSSWSRRPNGRKTVTGHRSTDWVVSDGHGALENGEQSPKVRGTFRAGRGAELGKEGSGHVGLEARQGMDFILSTTGGCGAGVTCTFHTCGSVDLCSLLGENDQVLRATWVIPGEIQPRNRHFLPELGGTYCTSAIRWAGLGAGCPVAGWSGRRVRPDHQGPGDQTLEPRAGVAVGMWAWEWEQGG